MANEGCDCGHIDAGLKNCLKNPYVALRKLVQLLEHPMSRDKTERQTKLFEEYLDATVYAVWLRDLPYIIRLFEGISKKRGQIPKFKKCLKSFFLLATVPPMLIKSSEVRDYARDFQQYFSLLGFLIIGFHDDELSELVLNTILNLLERKNPTGRCCVSLQFCQESAEKSQLPEIAGQLLEVLNEKLYPKLLEILFLLSEISESICKRVAHQNAINFLLRRLDPAWSTRDFDDGSRESSVLNDGEPPRSSSDISHNIKNAKSKKNIQNLEATTRVLWLLLNAIDDDHNTSLTPNIYGLWGLQYAFRILTNSKVDRVNRNDLGSITLKLLKIFENLELMQSGLADDIALLSVFTEQSLDATYKNVPDWAMSLEFRPNDEDFLFKKTLMACLAYFIPNDALKSLKTHNVFSGLLKILRKGYIMQWHEEQSCELITITFRILPRLLPHYSKKFISSNVPMLILNIVENYLENSNNFNVLSNCVLCLSDILSLDLPEVTDLFRAYGTGNIIMKLCQNLVEVEILTRMHQTCLGHAISVLHELNKFEIDLDATNFCIAYINRLLRPPPNDPLLDVKVTICVMSFLWDAVVPCPEKVSNFVKTGGVYLLLDTIQMCSFPVKLVALGIVADICSKGIAIPHMITWRKGGQRLLSLLMEIFRGRGRTLCASNSVDTEFPTLKQQKRPVGPCEDRQTKLAVAGQDLLHSCRPKIYAILYVLNNKFKKKVEVANEYYKLFNQPLSSDDQVTMLFAKNYMSLKLCESWTQLHNDITASEIEPTDEDRENLLKMMQLIENWKTYLLESGESLFEKEVEKEHINELYLYHTLKESKLSSALEALRDLVYISNCTEHLFLLRKKLRQSQDVDAHVLPHFKQANYHKTVTDNLSLSANLFNQTVEIQSNVIINNEEKKFVITPVSPMESLTNVNFKEEDKLSDIQLSCSTLEL